MDVEGVGDETIVKSVEVARNLPGIAPVGVRKLKRVDISQYDPRKAKGTHCEAESLWLEAIVTAGVLLALIAESIGPFEGFSDKAAAWFELSPGIAVEATQARDQSRNTGALNRISEVLDVLGGHLGQIDAGTARRRHIDAEWHSQHISRPKRVKIGSVEPKGANLDRIGTRDRGKKIAKYSLMGVG